MTIKITGTDIIDQSRNILTSTFSNYTEFAYNLGSISGSTPSITISNGNVQYGTLPNNAVTFSFNTTGMPSSGAFSFVLYLTNPGVTASTINWPASVKWQGNTTPPAGTGGWTTTANKTNVWSFITLDAGTSWYGILSQINV